MSAIAATLRPIPIPKPNVLRSDPAAQAFMLLRIAFTVAPILFGLDKFAEVMIDNWPKYLATEFNNVIPGSAAGRDVHRRGRRDRRRPDGPPHQSTLRRPPGRRVARRGSSSACCWWVATPTSPCATSASCWEH